MSQPRYGDSPVKRRKGRTSSKASKRKRATAIGDALLRGERRFAIVRKAREEYSHLSRNQAWTTICDLIDDGKLEAPGTSGPPSRASFYRWMDVAPRPGRALCAHDFMDEQRTGRPRKFLHPKLAEWLDREIRSGMWASAPRLFEDAKAFIKQERLRGPKLTLHQIEEFWNEYEIAELSAAQHGAKAALADGMPKATIYTERPFDVVTMDELGLPVFIKAVHPTSRKLVSVKPWGIIAADNHARTIPSFTVVPPYKYDATVGYRDEDIVGTFLAIALPELAPPACRAYGGYLPRVLRMDNHPTHHGLRELLKKRSTELEIEAEEAGCAPAPSTSATDLPSEEPHRRGLIERLVGTIKDLCRNIPGYDEKYLPTDRVQESQSRTRTRAAGGKGRETRKIAVRVQDLLDVDGLTAALGREIEKYHQREHRMLTTNPRTPDAAFQLKLDPEKTLPGVDAIAMLQPAILTVTAAGIDHRAGGKTVVFGHDVDGEDLLPGRQVKCFLDPLNRGIYADVDGSYRFLRPKMESARDRDPGMYSRDQKRKVREYSDSSEVALREKAAEALGEASAAAGVAEAETRVAELKADRKATKQRKRAETIAANNAKRATGELPPIKRPKKPKLAVSSNESTGKRPAPTRAPANTGAAARPRRGMVRRFGAKAVGE